MNEICVLILGVRQQAIPDSIPSPHFPITYQAMPTSILKQTNNRNPKGTVPLGLVYKFILDDHSALEKKSKTLIRPGPAQPRYSHMCFTSKLHNLAFTYYTGPEIECCRLL